MKSSCTKAENGNIDLVITIPWSEVQGAYNEVVEHAVANTELPGFRKGKAPRNNVEETLDKEKVYEEAIKRLIPKAYEQSVTEHALKPIMSPQISLTKAKEGEDWVVTAVTCEKPNLTIGDYRKAITELKNEKRNKIWVPGQGEKDPKAGEEKEQKISLDELLSAVYKTVSVSVPAILVEQEVTRMLSNLIDQTKKLGLTIEQYVTSTGKTIESLRKDYEEEAKRMITMELALSDIADTEGVHVEDKDIDDVIKTAKTPEEKASLERERYYVASVLRRQKTIQILASV